MAFVCFWTAPESVIFIFGFVLDFKSITFFLLVKPFFMFENLEMLHFPIWFWKKGTLSLWKQERNWKWIWSLSGHFKNKFKCYHIQNISSTYFCRISSNPPLLLNCRVLIWPDSKTMCSKFINSDDWSGLVYLANLFGISWDDGQPIHEWYRGANGEHLQNDTWFNFDYNWKIFWVSLTISRSYCPRSPRPSRQPLCFTSGELWSTQGKIPENTAR